MTATGDIGEMNKLIKPVYPKSFYTNDSFPNYKRAYYWCKKIHSKTFAYKLNIKENILNEEVKERESLYS